MIRGQRKWLEFCIYTSVELEITSGVPLLIASLSNPQERWKNQELTNHQEWECFLPLRRVHDDHMFSRTHLHL
jgi:hypothetical protein